MQESPTPFAAFIGIDWADKKHDICLVVAGSDKRERSILQHRPAALREWADTLRERFAGAPIAVCIELSQGPIVSALLEHDFFVLFPVQPTTLARYRNAFTPSRAKDDPTDAEFALELLLRHPEKLPRLEQESTPMRTLRRLVETRRALVDSRVRITNRLIAALKAYFPQVVSWFRDKEATVFADFVTRWPTLELAQRARDQTLGDFFRTHNVRYQSAITRRINAIRSEQPLTSDPAVIVPMRLLVEALLPQLRAANAGIERFDEEITRLGPQLPDYELFRALPGAGAALAPRLLVAFGERRERYPNAAALQKYAGIASVTERSGNKSWSIGATLAPSSCGRLSSSGSDKRSLDPSGLVHSIKAVAPAACATRLRFAHWLSSGSESSTAAGSNRPPTMKPATYSPFRNAMPRSSASLRTIQASFSIDGPPQGVS
jgi:transposase